MKCFDCGKPEKKLFDFADGRKTIKLCAMCKAEREWRENRDTSFPIPPPKINKSFWEKLKKFFKKNSIDLW